MRSSFDTDKTIPILGKRGGTKPSELVGVCCPRYQKLVRSCGTVARLPFGAFALLVKSSKDAWKEPEMTKSMWTRALKGGAGKPGTNAGYMLVILLLVSTSCGDGSTPAGPVEVLFVQSSSGAVLTESTLTLTGVRQETGWFTDRPYREGGWMRTARFVRGWDEGRRPFSETPPNAALSCNAAGQPVNLFLQLTSPRLEGDDLSYVVKGIGSDALPENLECDGTYLFIDNVIVDQWCEDYRNKLDLFRECIEDAVMF